MQTVKLTADTGSLDATLAALTEIAERLPEFCEALLALLDSGEELFVLNSDDGSALGASEVVVRFYPGDSLVRLVAAFRARHPDLCLFEHFPLQIERADCTTTLAEAQ